MTLSKAEADERLAQAIRDHADAFNLSHPDELLGDYAIIVHWQKIEDDGNSRYTMHYHREYVPGHIARGLFATAVELVNQGFYTDEDPE